MIIVLMKGDDAILAVFSDKRISLLVFIPISLTPEAWHQVQHHWIILSR
jgi:hypothetical protein